LSTLDSAGPRAGRWRLLSLAILAASAVLAEPAKADLKLCNATPSRIGVALGYQDKQGWATEGWWNLAAQSCEVLLRGPPPSRYIYVYAVDYDRGGEWSGSSAMCTTDKSFLIRDTSDCEKRGHRRTGFMEVDTASNKEWTIRLADPDEAASAR
jgi:uncharacterized membrane protein